ncbi:MAG: zinc ribbon domain-containing protein [Bdellovibrionales bacterium]|nr:zinc ribbon domain-containing protein [Bdellovibrionales bacterium]
MKPDNWRCPKCNHHDFEVGQFAATGGGLSRFFNVQNKRFSTVSCKRCYFTEIYKTTASKLTNIFDFLIGR